MKKVLVISYYWPPAGGSGVQRWVKFTRYLPSEGWQPVIYTPLNPEISSVDETLLKDIPAGTEIIKRPITEPYSLYRRLFGAKSSTDLLTLAGESGKARATGGEVNPISGGDKSLKQRVSLWIRGNFFIPDPRIWWVRPSIRFLKKYLREHPVDIIVTTGPPQSMHLIGRGVHRATGIPWIADFRDPWTRMFYYKHLHLTKTSDRIHHRLEKSVLDEADAIIAVSPLVQQDFQSMTSTPVVLITNGFDEDDFAASGSRADLREDTAPQENRAALGNVRGRGPSSDGRGPAQQDVLSGSSILPQVSDRFCVTHTGLFAEDGNPLALWDAIAAKCREDEQFRGSVRIRLAGKVDTGIIAALEERGLSDYVDNLGYVPHDEAVREQKGAGLLILPLRQEPEYRSVLPGKIFEYLAAGRPVLGIGQEDGAAAKILEDTCAGSMCGWDNASGIRRSLDSAWEMWKNGVEFRPKGIERYSRKHLTKTLATLMGQLLK